jgi:hypothetical protein
MLVKNAGEKCWWKMLVENTVKNAGGKYTSRIFHQA